MLCTVGIAKPLWYVYFNVLAVRNLRGITPLKNSWGISSLYTLFNASDTRSDYTRDSKRELEGIKDCERL